MAEAFPLYWPEGMPRTDAMRRERSRFETGFGAARNKLFEELSRMRATEIVLSTNVPVRNDGLPRANTPPKDGDVGVAVYFKRKGKQTMLACDKYKAVAENIYALAKTIEAMRGIERWGSQELMDKAFTGFQGLPQKASQAWRDVLGIGKPSVSPADIESEYKKLVMKYHPDNSVTGDRNRFEAIVQARRDALAELRS